MSTPAEQFSWLPEALESVALRLARSDEHAYKIGDLASKWSLDSQVVIPMLLTGLEMPKGLPPEIDIRGSGQSNRERLAGGGWDDAETRLDPLLQERFQEAEGRGVQFAPVTEDTIP